MRDDFGGLRGCGFGDWSGWLSMGKRNGERGVAAVEFAIVMPTIILISAATVAIGTAWRTNLRMQSVAADAARLCGVRPQADIENCLNALVTPQSISTNCASLEADLDRTTRGSTGPEGVEVVTLESTTTIQCSYELIPNILAMVPLDLSARVTVVSN